jgi:hypothetical protein
VKRLRWFDPAKIVAKTKILRMALELSSNWKRRRETPKHCGSAGYRKTSGREEIVGKIFRRNGKGKENRF